MIISQTCACVGGRVRFRQLILYYSRIETRKVSCVATRTAGGTFTESWLLATVKEAINMSNPNEENGIATNHQTFHPIQFHSIPFLEWQKCDLLYQSDWGYDNDTTIHFQQSRLNRTLALHPLIKTKEPKQMESKWKGSKPKHTLTPT